VIGRGGATEGKRFGGRFGGSESGERLSVSTIHPRPSICAEHDGEARWRVGVSGVGVIWHFAVQEITFLPQSTKTLSPEDLSLFEKCLGI
jgi:hypothetical protein